MIKYISKNIAYVKGPINSAIYDFNAKKVYSINDFGTKILTQYITEHHVAEQKEKDFIKQICGILNTKDLNDNDYIFEEIPEKKLQFVWLEVTQGCPCRCIHCYEGKEHFECSNPLKFDEWMSVIDGVAELSCKEIRFIGGEPTLYKDLGQLINYCSEKNIEKISIFSNLYCIDNQKLLDAIIHNNVEVHFSIYGSNSKAHDLVTQTPGSFDRLISNLKLLKNHSIPLVAHVVAIKENEESVDEIYQFLNNLDISNIKYDEFRKVHGVCDSSHAVKNSRISGKKQNFKTTKEQFELSNFVNTCWFAKCVISSDGNVYPCEMEKSFSYGNIRQSSIKDIILSNTINKFWYWNFEKVDSCKMCELRFACRDCRPLAYAENGSLNTKNPRCTYNPNTGSWQ